MPDEKRNPTIVSENTVSPIERGVRFMVDTLFRGDLAVWDKELEVICPKLGINRQPRRNNAQ